jgi:S1-C subfamily serine protease
MASDGVTNDGTAADDGYLQGDIITASTWTVTGTDALLVVASSSFTNTTTTVKLTGGTVGVTYGVINHITMASTLEDDRTLYVEVVQK